MRIMKKMVSAGGGAIERRTWILPLSTLSISSLFLLFLTTDVAFLSSFSLIPYNPFSSDSSETVFVESKFLQLTAASSSSSSLPSPPRFAYLISGSKGDGERLKRTLQALYHPLNFYAVHLDLESPPAERMELEKYVREEDVFSKVGNVVVMSKANLVTYKGPTMVANTLQAAAILLRKSAEWDWFINLSASDYPLVTQDDLLHTFSYLPRDLNFIEHTSNIGWKDDHNLVHLFSGSAWMVLSRSFMEFCIWGWDNLPRRVLMYYANFISSPEGYFHTVICNTKEFRNTTVNHDLHYIAWDNPPKQHPHNLGLNDTQMMIDSNAPFARKFKRDDPVLDKIDAELLGRSKGALLPGGWCSGDGQNGSNPCSVLGDPSVLRPGPGAMRLEHLTVDLLSHRKFRPRQCR
ncbi:hypothetical protein AMTRI_Chr09g18890 [Amborella trichopoda]